MRTFVAIEIAEPLKLKIDRSVEDLRSGLKEGLIRWARLESMHLTLKFLGEIDPEQLQTIHEILDQVAGRFSSFSLEVAGFGCFPNRSRPRVVWVGFRPVGGDLPRLQSELAGRLETIGFEREQRGYHPHLTLGRVRKGLSGPDMKQVSEWAQQAQIETVGIFEVDAIGLIRSVLKPDGAEYSNLHVARLAS